MTEEKSTNLAIRSGGGVQLSSLKDMCDFCRDVYKSGVIPPSIKSASQLLVALEYGLEVGLKPMQSLQSVVIINNVPSLPNSPAMALILDSKQLAKIREWTEGEFPEENYTCFCEMKRTNGLETLCSFSIADAKIAKLWGLVYQSGKPSPWVLHPKDMLAHKARARAIHRIFEDILRGFHITEDLIGEQIGGNAPIEFSKGDFEVTPSVGQIGGTPEYIAPVIDMGEQLPEYPSIPVENMFPLPPQSLKQTEEKPKQEEISPPSTAVVEGLGATKTEAPTPTPPVEDVVKKAHAKKTVPTAPAPDGLVAKIKAIIPTLIAKYGADGEDDAIQMVTKGEIQKIGQDDERLYELLKKHEKK